MPAAIILRKCWLMLTLKDTISFKKEEKHTFSIAELLRFPYSVPTSVIVNKCFVITIKRIENCNKLHAQRCCVRVIYFISEEVESQPYKIYLKNIYVIF